MSNLDRPSTQRRAMTHLDEGLDALVEVIDETLTRLHVPFDDVLTARVREMASGFCLDAADRLLDPDPLIDRTARAIYDLIRALNSDARALTGHGDAALRAGIMYGLTKAVGQFSKGKTVLLKARLRDMPKEGE
jgi:aminoglycoside phosphotransferase